ncbi:hypothetical protein [Shewanella frigidimarina]|uniref:hypothetical protein n=1 Tax=Shewanella frigidimarina TaxID=56812 RepID=UPI000AFFDC38|nr:hypothetical protein [Shewanella frigidimarina]
MGANNVVTVDQDGHHNKAYAESEWGEANEIVIDQTGSEHLAEVYVSGTGRKSCW